MKTGEQLKLFGIERALDHANEKHENWADVAYDFLKKFIKKNKRFMTEDLRKSSEGVIPQPPSNRAWGGVVRRARNEELIRHFGYGQVKNPLAHCANASVWVSN